MKAIQVRKDRNKNQIKTQGHTEKYIWEGNTKAEQAERWEQEMQILILANH